MKIQKPINQKSVYHSFAMVYDQLMNDQIPVEKAEIAVQALAGMNRTYALELKRAEIEKQPMEKVIIKLLELQEEDKANT